MPPLKYGKKCDNLVACVALNAIVTRMRKTRSKYLDAETISFLNGLFDEGEATRFAIVDANVSPGTIKNAAEGKGLRPKSFHSIMKAVSLNKSKAS